MSAVAVLVRQLESYLQEELDAQRRVCECLTAQRDELLRSTPAAARGFVDRLEAQLAKAPARAQRRHDLVRRLATQFGVATGTLTLSSIVERLGTQGERLARMANELREATRECAVATRKLAALSRLHARLNDEILDAVLALRGGGANRASDPFPAPGALVDAEV